MFDGLRTIGKWILIILGILIVLASVIPHGWHDIFAAIGNLLHNLGNGLQTAKNHAKHGG